MYLSGLSVFSPKETKSALEMLTEYGDNGRPVAGGTDLLVQMKNGRLELECLVDLSQVQGLSYIEPQADVVTIGSLVTHAALSAHPEFNAGGEAILGQAARSLGSPQVRNRGTLGGNLVTASPAGDVSTALLALDARVTLTSANDYRGVMLKDFFKGPGQTVKRSDELVTAVEFRRPKGNAISVYLKVGKRKAMAISIVSLGAVIELEGGLCQKVAVSLGAVAPTPVRANSVEAYLVGKPLQHGSIQEAVQLLEADISPITDLRASAAYRMHLAKTLLRRALEQAAGTDGR